jgi:hypothetical protein
MDLYAHNISPLKLPRNQTPLPVNHRKSFYFITDFPESDDQQKKISYSSQDDGSVNDGVLTAVVRFQVGAF